MEFGKGLILSAALIPLLVFFLMKWISPMFVSTNKRWAQTTGNIISKCKVQMSLLVFLSIIIIGSNDRYLITIPIVALIFFGFLIWALFEFKKLLRFTDAYSERAYNYTLQSAILIVIVGIIAYTVIIVDHTGMDFLPLGFLAALMGWIFQDAIKGIVSFFHLRINGLLHIGDWIEVHSHGIDGIITEVSLVTVTVRNWDNTISNISLSALQTGAFKNNQEMLDGKTSGRRMNKFFNIDASSIKCLSASDIQKLIETLNEYGEETLAIEVETAKREGKPVLNIFLYRMYLRHWLMNNNKLSRGPFLMVNLQEPTERGVPLQVFTYILETSFIPYELVQSEIIDHILMTMKWFGLRLFQQPSGKDVSNVSITPKEH